jgi:polysaccharide export outer membrane protein
MARILLLLVCSGGCHFIYPGRNPNGPKPAIPPAIPRELSKTTLPDYIIEPPDVLSIEAVSLIPKLPYTLRPLDTVTIVTTGLPAEGDPSGEYVIPPSGAIQFGLFGMVPAAGRTTDELQQALLEILARDYRAPSVTVTLAQIASQQQIVGEHLVAPDGKVNLGTYGRVRVVGMSIEEARAALEAHLSQYLQDPQLAIDVLGYNSKVYYVVMQGAGFGDAVSIHPSRGNETVLDAIGQINGLSSNSSTRMWIARPGSNYCNGDQILPIDWVAVTQRGDITTNYQILPGDRLYVSEDKLVAFDTRLGKIFAPLERMMGFTSLGISTAQSIDFYEQQGQFSGFGGPGF